MQLQQQVNAIVNDLSNRSLAFKEEYTKQIKRTKQQWIAKRHQFEMEKLQMILPSKNGVLPIGTEVTRSYCSYRDQLGYYNAIGSCLADIVDAVDSIANGIIQNKKFTEVFTMPSPPAYFDPEALKKIQQAEASKRQELNDLTLQCRTAEDQRSCAWKKLLKIKGEHKMHHHLYTSSGSYRLIQLDASNYTRFPLPSLQESHLESIPQIMGHLPVFASFTPSMRTTFLADKVDVSLLAKHSFSALRKRIATVEESKKCVPTL